MIHSRNKTSVRTINIVLLTHFLLDSIISFVFLLVEMSKIPTRPLGKNGPQVSAIGYGAMGLSAFYGTPAPDEERFKVIDHAIELGSTYIDSADVYGDNEELLGKYFKKHPEQRKKVSNIQTF
jgi:hypothetical protein